MYKRLPNIKLFFYLSSAIIFTSCNKENNTNQFDPFFKVTVNGSKKTVNTCGTSDFVISYLKDTAVFASIGCDGLGIGFYLKGKIIDGTYELNSGNIAWFEEGFKNYSTNNLSKGTVTLKTGRFLAAGGLIPFVEGVISFDAFQKNSGEKISITSGKYLLKKFQY